jgi:hypothetical protein
MQISRGSLSPTGSVSIFSSRTGGESGEISIGAAGKKPDPNKRPASFERELYTSSSIRSASILSTTSNESSSSPLW